MASETDRVLDWIVARYPDVNTLTIIHHINDSYRLHRTSDMFPRTMFAGSSPFIQAVALYALHLNERTTIRQIPGSASSAGPIQSKKTDMLSETYFMSGGGRSMSSADLALSETSFGRDYIALRAAMLNTLPTVVRGYGS